MSVFLVIDVHGKMSAALETLRQIISKGQILTIDSYHFKLLSSGTISYMATCCVSGSGGHHSNVIPHRLSRLFSIFVLPSLSMDVVLSIHSPQLKSWLKDVPLQQNIEDMACCIITATKSLYHAVCDLFQPTLQRPHYIFSHHDLQKVFCGMCLWQPDIQNTGTFQKQENLLPEFCPALSRPAASFLKIVRLWMHECMRTFSDRLCSEDESKTLVSLIAKAAKTHYGIGLFDEIPPAGADDPTSVSDLTFHTQPNDTASTCKSMGQSVETQHQPQEPKPAEQSDLMEDCASTETFLLSENNHSGKASLKTHPQQPQKLGGHMEGTMAKLVYGPGLSEVIKSLNKQRNSQCSFSYQEQNLDVLLQDLCELLDSKEEDKNHNGYNITTRCVAHRQRVSQLLHILRALLIPGGHGVLMSSEKGAGRKTTVRLAAYVTGYQLMEVHPGNESQLHEILKEAVNQTRVDGVNVIILVHEGISRTVREKLLVAMAHRTFPGLHTDEELRNLVSRVTAGKNSRRYLMDSWMFKK